VRCQVQRLLTCAAATPFLFIAIHAKRPCSKEGTSLSRGGWGDSCSLAQVRRLNVSWCCPAARMAPDPQLALANLCNLPRALAECANAAPLLSSELDVAAWHTTARSVAAAAAAGQGQGQLSMASASTGSGGGKGVLAATSTTGTSLLSCGGLALSSSMRRRCKRLSLLLEVADVVGAEVSDNDEVRPLHTDSVFFGVLMWPKPMQCISNCISLHTAAALQYWHLLRQLRCARF
jgi:hypothetical protein